MAGPQRETYNTVLSIHYNDSTSFLKGPIVFVQATVHREEGNNNTFQGLLDIGSKLKLLSGNPTHLHALLEWGLIGIKNGVFTKVLLTIGPLGSKLTGHNCIVGIDRIGIWNNITLTAAPVVLS